jgi:hypothetical protein
LINDLSLNVSAILRKRPDHRFDRVGADQARAGHAGESGEEPARRIQKLLEELRPDYQGRPGGRFRHNKKIGGLLRFASSKTEDEQASAWVSTSRTGHGTRSTCWQINCWVKNSPHPGSVPEGIEVLLTDRTSMSG